MRIFPHFRYGVCVSLLSLVTMAQTTPCPEGSLEALHPQETVKDTVTRFREELPRRKMNPQRFRILRALQKTEGLTAVDLDVHQDRTRDLEKDGLIEKVPGIVAKSASYRITPKGNEALSLTHRYYHSLWAEVVDRATLKGPAQMEGTPELETLQFAMLCSFYGNSRKTNNDAYKWLKDRGVEWHTANMPSPIDPGFYQAQRILAKKGWIETNNGGATWQVSETGRQRIAHSLQYYSLE